MHIIEVNPKNILKETLFCVKDIKSEAFKNKHQWFLKRIEEGLKIKILKDENDKALGYIEYTPAEFAWRPINAPNYMFIQCMYIYSKSDREKGLGSMLIQDCEGEAISQGMDGICTFASNGTWIANKKVFSKNDYHAIGKHDRFDLMAKKLRNAARDPEFIDWEEKIADYDGWNLLYSDQCPWNKKSVDAILEVANNYKIDINIKRIESAYEAQNSPSGFGVFALLKDKKLLEDHYLSKNRFENIVKREMNIK